ncbi:MAG TPA: hypothetical protein VMQ73_13685 [Methylomirabilota bacterium]|nr:hypothetical protein [Methylomirabilota bacterium]
MSNAPINEYGSTVRTLSVLAPARDFVFRLWRALRACIAAAASELHERAVPRAEHHSAMADSSLSRLHRNVMKIEARRLL